MSGENIEGTISVEDHVEPAEQRLVGGRTGQAASRKAVDEKRRHAHFVEMLGPQLVAAVNAAGAMEENNGRHFAGGAARNSQFTGNAGSLAVLVAGEKLLVAQRQRFNGPQLRACGQ